MSATVLLLTALVVWCAIGIVISIWMRRRGHAFFMWLYLGTVLGPLVIPLALEAIFSERVVGTVALHPSPSDRGKLAVLVGVDGSSESVAAARAAVDLLADRIGRVTLAAVVDYDSAVVDYDSTGYSMSERRRAAEAHLDSAARAVAFENPEREILVGSPADALARAAHEGGFDLLVVGHRGRGASRALLGSVASRLASGPTVPILIGGRPTDGGE